MKATGIVRRIDDLGRVVIPKEIRRILWSVPEPEDCVLQIQNQLHQQDYLLISV